MQPQEYHTIWTSKGDVGLPADEQQLSTFNLQPSTKEFLRMGLPVDAAPYLTFIDNTGDNYISRLEDEYETRVEQGQYIVIGSDGAGNPIVINTHENDRIEWLDHENGFEAAYCNRSIESLLVFLIIYRDFVSEVIDANGEDAFLDCNFTEDQFNTLKQKMLMADARAVNDASFWKEELALLLTNRQYYKENG